MQLFPAIDLRHGRCVRLKQGNFAFTTDYGMDPVSVLRSYERVGAKWVHIVDLDGAKDGASRQTDLIRAMAGTTPLRVQTGGGVRSIDDIQRLLDAGVARVVIGSLAVKEPDTVRGWLEKFGGDRIVLAFDVRLDDKGLPEVLTQGWQTGSQQNLWDVLAFYKEAPLQTVLCTDISKDGMMQGCNVALYRVLMDQFPKLQVMASGGVSSLDDLLALQGQGLYGAIIGKALFEGRLDLKEALARLA